MDGWRDRSREQTGDQKERRDPKVKGKRKKKKRGEAKDKKSQKAERGVVVY